MQIIILPGATPNVPPSSYTMLNCQNTELNKKKESATSKGQQQYDSGDRDLIE